jgi:polyhydroxyalkanoate synthesis regulator phasin
MSNLFERSIFLSIGVAAVAKELADTLTEELVKRGATTTEEGRQAFEEVVDKAKGEASTMRGKFDSKIQRGYRDMGVATSEQVDEMQLKIAQLEHRMTLLEAAFESNGKVTEEAMTPSGDKASDR